MTNDKSRSKPKCQKIFIFALRQFQFSKNLIEGRRRLDRHQTSGIDTAHHRDRSFRKNFSDRFCGTSYHRVVVFRRMSFFVDVVTANDVCRIGTDVNVVRFDLYNDVIDCR